MKDIDIKNRELKSGDYILYYRRDGRVFLLKILYKKLNNIGELNYTCKILNCSPSSLFKIGQTAILSPNDILSSEIIYLLDDNEIGIYVL